jgi:putative ABC transport system permease protein
VAAVSGVEASAQVYTGLAGYADQDGETWYYAAFGIDPDAFREVVLDRDIGESFQPGTVMLRQDFVTSMKNMTRQMQSGYQESDESFAGTTMKLIGADGQVLERTVVEAPEYGWPLPGDAVLVDLETLRELGGQITAPEVWLKTEPGADVTAVMGEVQDTVTGETESGGSSEGFAFMVSGQAAERASLENVVDTMVLVGLGLLAVSIIVALVGVSNTLWLSVLERSRETAMMRALGLTRRQTSRMMALEGAIIASVAGLTGVALGVFFGLAGCALLLSATDFMTLSVPIWRVLSVLALAIVTGLVASIMPGRRAAKTPPAEALAAAG